MKKFLGFISYVLVVVGALNWGLWGVFQFDVVAWIFGGNATMLSRVIYTLVGLGGLWMLFGCSKVCKAMCSCCCKKD